MTSIRVDFELVLWFEKRKNSKEILTHYYFFVRKNFFFFKEKHYNLDFDKKKINPK